MSYYEEHKDQVTEYQAKYRHKNREQIREYFKVWYQKNKQKVQESNKRYRDKRKQKERVMRITEQTHTTVISCRRNVVVDMR